jgi:hypothetical protein
LLLAHDAAPLFRDSCEGRNPVPLSPAGGLCARATNASR